jgi:hypothetical protein
MSAVLNPPTVAKRDQAFVESQSLPAEKRGASFEALFYRALQQVTARIHETDNLDQIMLDASQDICKLFNADRLTLYAVNDDGTAIVSKIKTGLNSSRDLKLPISPQSLAGFAAFSKQLINLADVYDDAALKKIHSSLTFLKEVDKRSGYRTREMIVAPIMEADKLHGVLQIINNKSNQPFSDLEVEGVSQLCKTLGTAIRQRMQRAVDQQRTKATRFDGLVSDGVISKEELQQAVEEARAEAVSVEHMLMSKFKVKPAQIGPSLSKFFGVPYEPFKAGRIKAEMLHGALKRDFVMQQGWLPLEDSPEGLVVICVDPEAVRGARMVPQVFPKFMRYAYRVTTQTEFEETVDQIFGALADTGSIDDLLADMDSGPIESLPLPTTNW